VAIAAFAQKPAAGPKYDVATEAKFKGVIEEVKEVPNSCLGDTGTHLMLKTGNGIVEIQVAPPDFLKFMDISFAKGEEIQVVGSQVTVNGNPLVLARTITRNNNDVAVRDSKGTPAWTWMKKG
jgi:hypothetical protein